MNSVDFLDIHRVWKRRGHLFFLHISENGADIFVIFDMHHPNESRKWVIKHFPCIFTTDDVIVTSVKMEDKHVINVLLKNKQYSC